MAEVRRGVGEHADDTEGDSAEQNPRAELTPAAAGTVSNESHAGVGDSVQRAGQQEHGANKASGNTKDVSVEKHHVQHDVIEDDMAGGVAHAVAYLLLHRDNLTVHSSYPSVTKRSETG